MKSLLIVFILALASTGRPAELDQNEVLKFRKQKLCPSTNNQQYPCPEYRINLDIPQCVGGQNKASNMHWFSYELYKFKVQYNQESCNSWYAKTYFQSN